MMGWENGASGKIDEAVPLLMVQGNIFIQELN
jgi:hypothetical protein